MFSRYSASTLPSGDTLYQFGSSLRTWGLILAPFALLLVGSIGEVTRPGLRLGDTPLWGMLAGGGCVAMLLMIMIDADKWSRSGVITPISHLVIQRTEQGKALSVGSRTWPASEVKRFDLGHRRTRTNDGPDVDVYTVYLVLPREVLRLCSFPNDAAAQILAEELIACLGINVRHYRGSDETMSGFGIRLLVFLFAVLGVVGWGVFGFGRGYPLEAAALVFVYGLLLRALFYSVLPRLGRSSSRSWAITRFGIE